VKRIGGGREAAARARSRRATTIAGRSAIQVIRAISVNDDIPDFSSWRSLFHPFRTFEAST
jgi:hypothetical protein